MLLKYNRMESQITGEGIEFRGENSYRTQNYLFRNFLVLNAMWWRGWGGSYFNSDQGIILY